MVPFFHTLFTPFSHDFHTHSPSSDSTKLQPTCIAGRDNKEVVMCIYMHATVQYDQTHLDFLWALEIS